MQKQKKNSQLKSTKKSRQEQKHEFQRNACKEVNTFNPTLSFTVAHLQAAHTSVELLSIVEEIVPSL